MILTVFANVVKLGFWLEITPTSVARPEFILPRIRATVLMANNAIDGNKLTARALQMVDLE